MVNASNDGTAAGPIRRALTAYSNLVTWEDKSRLFSDNLAVVTGFATAILTLKVAPYLHMPVASSIAFPFLCMVGGAVGKAIGERIERAYPEAYRAFYTYGAPAVLAAVPSYTGYWRTGLALAATYAVGRVMGRRLNDPSP